MVARRIGLFYGSSTCYTEITCEKIVAMIAEHYSDWQTQIHNIADDSIQLSVDYHYAIYGIPTWDYGELQEDWDNQWDQLATLDLKHQTAAIYGLGDQVGYPQWYQDAIGYLYAQLAACGTRLCGLWPISEPSIEDGLLNHNYQQSQAISDDGSHFLGLPLDDENQPELTEQRLKIWLGLVFRQFDQCYNEL